MEIDSLELSRAQSKKKLKEKDCKKQDKKRKRHTSDDLELASPTKKHRSTHRSEPPVSHGAAQTQLEPPNSPFYEQTSSLYLPLPPISQKHALQGLCAEHISPLILTYYPPFHGVIISYSNASLSSDPNTDPNTESKPAYAQAIDEYAASFVWLIADFVVFKPQKGDVVEGWINLQNESNIGLLCLNFFNATIERNRLAYGWKWISGGMKPWGKRKLKKAAKGAGTDSDEDEEASERAEESNLEDAQGYFQDAQGRKVEGLIRFRVKDLETSRGMDRETGFLNIEGTMLRDEEEIALRKQEAIRMNERGKKQPKHAMTGALANGNDGSIDIDQNADSTPTLKHRGKY